MPGGTFYRSYDLAGDFYSGNMGFPATVSDFRLDTYEVTVGRFRHNSVDSLAHEVLAELKGVSEEPKAEAKTKMAEVK